MFPTMEVRWFYEGTIPADVSAWFDRGKQPSETASSRVDYYLCPVEGNFLGIKLREGKIEVKQRYHQYEVVHLHQRVAGQMELWRKWSFPLAGADTILTALKLSPQFWVEVHKTRRQQAYQITANREIVARFPDRVPEQGCNLELTTVNTAGKKWWTLGCEAFGDEPALRDNLLLVARHIFAKHPPPALTVEDSQSYPALLNFLCK